MASLVRPYQISDQINCCLARVNLPVDITSPTRASDTLFDSRVGFSGSTYLSKTLPQSELLHAGDCQVARALADILGFGRSRIACLFERVLFNCTAVGCAVCQPQLDLLCRLALTTCG